MSPKITYLAGIRTRDDRQKTLKERFYFDCKCVLCETEKEEPVVNYDELFRLRTSLNSGKFANDQLHLAKRYILDMQKIFCKYDERITNFYDKALEKMVVTLLQGPYALMVTASKVKEFEKQVEENLRITYGVDHRDYKFFAAEVAQRLANKSK